jgi:hypothetical protein
MSNAIDFNIGVRYSGQDVSDQSHLITGQKVRAIDGRRARAVFGVDVTSSDEYLQAKQADDDDQLHDNEKNSCCPSISPYIDFFSGLISLVCFILSICFWGILGPRTVRINQNILVFANRSSAISSNMTDAMRHFRTIFKSNFRNEDVVIQVPHYGNDIAVMQVSVHTATIEIWGLLTWIYFWSSFFQLWRFYQSKELEGRKSFGFPWPHRGLYKPWRGPEFSRWLEYLFTSPCQAVLVSIAFGFGSLDTLLGHFGMQTALVLFGYDIEQQVKKLFKRALQEYETEDTWQAEGLKPQRMHHVPTRNLRLYVYLVITWLLHSLIWGLSIPRTWSAPWGIGGQYYRSKRNLEANKERFTLSDMPWFVELVFWSQYFFFTLFGIVCTGQVIQALFFIKPRKPNKETLDELNQAKKPFVYSEKEATVKLFKSRVRKNWSAYSQGYAILSITAKTFLEIGFLAIVHNTPPWTDDNVQLLLQKNCSLLQNSSLV